MSQFLRDEFLKNLEFSEESLRKINSELIEIAANVNKSLNPNNINNPKFLIPFYIIRFDNKGFRLFNFEDVMKYYKDAKDVERMHFHLYCTESYKNRGEKDKSIELRLDKKNINNCYLILQDEDSHWVDATFWKIKERLTRYQNKNFLIRNKLVPFAVQLLGVIFGFFASLWLAIQIAPIINIENSLAFAFIIILLIFSNIWTYFYAAILKFLDYLFPNISFREKRAFCGAIKGLISAILVSMFLYILSLFSLSAVKMVKSILIK